MATNDPVQSDQSGAPVPIRLAEQPVVLALDLGTSSVRGLLYDRRGRPLEDSLVQLEYDIETTPDGGAEAPAHLLLALTEECVDRMHEHCGAHQLEVQALGISCFWHSMLGLSAEGEPATPVFYWADSRSADDAAALRDGLSEAAFRAQTGCVFHSSYWPAKWHWLSRVHPEVAGQVASWCSAADYIVERWTGELVMSVSMASGTGLLDIHRATWDTALVEAIGLPSATLPRLVDRQEGISLDAPHQRRWPGFARATIFPALGDGACANVGSGATDASRVALTLGTTGALRLLAERPVGTMSPIYPDLFAYRLDRQTMVYGAAISNGGGLLDWLREAVADDDGSLLMATATIPPDSHGLTILPFLAGERAPIWNDRARGVIAGLDLATSRTEILRAGLEAVAYRLALLHRHIAGVAAADHAVVANGAALLRSPLWLRIVTDALGRPVQALPAHVEASARGAALCALDSLGLNSALTDAARISAAHTVQPDPINTAIYATAADRQQALETLLYPSRTAWDGGFSP